MNDEAREKMLAVIPPGCPVHGYDYVRPSKPPAFVPEGMLVVTTTNSGTVFRKSVHRCEPPAPETRTLEVGDVFGCVCGAQWVLIEPHEIYKDTTRHWIKHS